VAETHGTPRAAVLCRWFRESVRQPKAFCFGVANASTATPSAANTKSTTKNAMPWKMKNSGQTQNAHQAQRSPRRKRWRLLQPSRRPRQPQRWRSAARFPSPRLPRTNCRERCRRESIRRAKSRKASHPYGRTACMTEGYCPIEGPRSTLPQSPGDVPEPVTMPQVARIAEAIRQMDPYRARHR
jgi:hypothetical protein